MGQGRNDSKAFTMRSIFSRVLGSSSQILNSSHSWEVGISGIPEF